MAPVTFCGPSSTRKLLGHDSVFGDEISHKPSLQNSGAENYCTFDEIFYSFFFYLFIYLFMAKILTDVYLGKY